MLQPAIDILDRHRMMAISTVRPDGWPQTTMVGYANDGWDVYFLIFRESQKFNNISRDDRVSIAVHQRREPWGHQGSVRRRPCGGDLGFERARARLETAG
jgi:nitroimidazol reductase NimA-like FMN-containing flavoprotein (pyridoxamine 5'-phosphate oxidase superfamily)